MEMQGGQYSRAVLSKLQNIYPGGCKAMGRGKEILEFLCQFILYHPFPVPFGLCCNVRNILVQSN